ncbi:hypothetical protein [Aquimarina sp. MAR_2010_214]|uniref:hypothetical protein n=1 Tax=Aquimarina sp. MAR_2010_214 TaxID=1250026 RepID=UPI001178064F|nr:hypothetical protein [Aquimarina sp. MAR_2010_214]
MQYVEVEKDEFLQRVANKECYELTIYNWTMRLFDKGTSIEDAIHLIHRARRFVLINRTYRSFSYPVDISIENIHTMLNEYPKYNQLSSNKKQIVQQKIAEKFDQKARLEAIEQVLKKMHLEGRLEPDNNKRGIFTATLLRFKDSIMKWKCIEYWQKKNRSQ